MIQIELTNEERQSAVWQKLRSAIEQELALLRLRNDGDIEPIATARTRGRIAVCKELLALEQSGPEQAVMDPVALHI